MIDSELCERRGNMRALSIKQPWAYLICSGLKDVENRSWQLPLEMYGERIYVHASLRADRDSFDRLIRMGFSAGSSLLLQSNKMSAGAIIGEITLVGCVERSDSPCFWGPFGWILSHPRLYEEPIPHKGQPRFFSVGRFAQDANPGKACVNTACEHYSIRYARNCVGGSNSGFYQPDDCQFRNCQNDADIKTNSPVNK